MIFALLATKGLDSALNSMDDIWVVAIWPKNIRQRHDVEGQGKAYFLFCLDISLTVVTRPAFVFTEDGCRSIFRIVLESFLSATYLFVKLLAAIMFTYAFYCSRVARLPILRMYKFSNSKSLMRLLPTMLKFSSLYTVLILCVVLCVRTCCDP